MSAAASNDQFLPAVEFDFLWEAADLGELPYPLHVASHGATVAERAALRHRVHERLQAQRLMDAAGRLAPRLASELGLLGRGPQTIDALFALERGATPVAALAATDGATGVLALQDTAGLWLRPIFPDACASEVVALLPQAQRGTERSTTLARAEAARIRPDPAAPGGGGRHRAGDGRAGGARAGDDRAGEHAPEGEARPRRRLAERTAGDQRQDYARLAGQPRLRGGQFAANSRDRLARKARSPVLAWFDTASGRYLAVTRTGSDGHEWTTVAPVDARTLRSRLAEMAAELPGELVQGFTR